MAETAWFAYRLGVCSCVFTSLPTTVPLPGNCQAAGPVRFGRFPAVAPLLDARGRTTLDPGEPYDAT
jgi:hypothetical protein